MLCSYVVGAKQILMNATCILVKQGEQLHLLFFGPEAEFACQYGVFLVTCMAVPSKCGTRREFVDCTAETQAFQPADKARRRVKA